MLDIDTIHKLAKTALRAGTDDVQVMIDTLRAIADGTVTNPNPTRCQSRCGAYECALAVGHSGAHGDEGQFTNWPDSADTRETIDAEAEAEARHPR